MSYNENKKVVNYIAATLHLILMCTIIAYLVVSKIRKHRLSKFQWIYMINLACVEFLTTIVLYGYFGIGSGDNHECNYYDKVFYGAADIFLFNLLTIFGFK